MTPCRCKNIYFLVCLALVLGLGSIRSYPVYGKMDFILLPGRPWWPPWRTMIDDVLQQGEKPIVSDIVTSTVFRAVFAQKAVAFRFSYRYGQIDIERLNAENSQQLQPLGPLLLLLKNTPEFQIDGDLLAESRGRMITRMLIDAAVAERQVVDDGKNYPYRCLINLHGFTPSWVPAETGHWSENWADPSLIYEFKGMRGKKMVQLLRDDPPANCMVYF